MLVIKYQLNNKEGRQHLNSDTIISRYSIMRIRDVVLGTRTPICSSGTCVDGFRQPVLFRQWTLFVKFTNNVQWLNKFNLPLTSRTSCEPPPVKKSKLFGSIITTTRGPVQLYNTKQCLIVDDDMSIDWEYDIFSFWRQHRQQLDKLYHLALRALSVPASSSPVFSKGGLGRW